MFRPLAAALACSAIFFVQTAHSRVNLPDFSDLVAKAGPAVVNLNTVKTDKTQGRMRDMLRRSPRGGPLDELFDQFDRFFPDGQEPSHRQHSLGSGFLISKDGFIVTNNHVVDGADEIKVQMQGVDSPMTAKLIGSDPELDLAVVKIENSKDLPFLEFGDSDQSKVGSWVVAIGNPFGLQSTVTAGIVSAKGRVIGAGPFDDFIQTDTSINPGNSGGPLLDMDGRVVGINTAIVASGQGIGFAIPANLAKGVIDDLRQHKSIKRGWLGVSIQDMDENSAKALGLKQSQGALVTSVTPGDPAAKAGVLVGDVILEVNSQPTKDANAVLRAIAAIKPGGQAMLAVWRKEKVLKLTATLGQRDTAQQKAMEQNDEQSASSKNILGLSLRPVRPEEAKALGLDSGKGLVVMDVNQGAPADEAEVRPGDVILEANQEPVASMADLERIVERKGSGKGVILLLIKRNKQSLFRAVPIPK
jgi:serine protease Do